MYDKQLQRTLYLFYLSKFLTGLRFFVPIWLIFAERFLNLSIIGVVEAVSYMLAIVVDIPSGALADMIGRRNILMIGWLGVGTFHILQGFSPTAAIYIYCAILANIFWTIASSADTALIYDNLKQRSLEKKFTQINGYGLFAFRIGIILATFLGGWLYEIRISLPFTLLGIAELLCVVCWYFVTEPKVDSPQFSWSGYLTKMKDGILQTTKTSYAKSLSLFYVLVGGITFSSFYFFNYSYAVDLGLSPMQQSILFGFTGIAKALVVLVFARYAKNLTRNQVYVGFALFMLFSYLPAMFVGRNIAIFIITVLETLGVARYAFLDAFINDEFASEHRATALSFMNMMVNVVYLIIVAIGGFVAHAHGTSTLYTLIGILTLVSVVPISIRLIKHPARLSL